MIMTSKSACEYQDFCEMIPPLVIHDTATWKWIEGSVNEPSIPELSSTTVTSKEECAKACVESTDGCKAFAIDSADEQ